MSALPTAGPVDEDLAARIAAGDQDAFAELYRRYARPLAAYAGRILRDSAAGEDVAQVSLFNAYQALQRGSRPTFVRAWLYRIARNAALEAIEKRGDVVPLDDRDPSFEEPLDAHAARADLVAAVRALPERQRNVYALRELQGLRVSEISERLELTTEQVEQALFAARNKLAEKLEFGERLDCASVRSLTEARLSRTQRRAVKSHLRSCTACRSSSGLRVGALALPIGWLRDGAAALFGGGAAKAAAVVAAATAAGAIPVVATHPPHLSFSSHSQSTDAPALRPEPVAAPGRNVAATKRASFAPQFLGSAMPLVLPPALDGKSVIGNEDQGVLAPSRRAESSIVESEPATEESSATAEPQEAPTADEPAHEAEPLPDEQLVKAQPDPARDEPVLDQPVDETPPADRPADEPPPADVAPPTDVTPEPPANAERLVVEDTADAAPNANAAPDAKAAPDANAAP